MLGINSTLTNPITYKSKLFIYHLARVKFRGSKISRFRERIPVVFFRFRESLISQIERLEGFREN